VPADNGLQGIPAGRFFCIRRQIRWLNPEKAAGFLAENPAS
jgi:hypothetical protein